MATFTCSRFPHGEWPIRTAAGIVVFRDGTATVEDDDVARALTEVPAVFGISEQAAQQRPETERPAKRRSASKRSQTE